MFTTSIWNIFSIYAQSIYAYLNIYPFDNVNWEYLKQQITSSHFRSICLDVQLSKQMFEQSLGGWICNHCKMIKALVSNSNRKVAIYIAVLYVSVYSYTTIMTDGHSIYGHIRDEDKIAEWYFLLFRYFIYRWSIRWMFWLVD